MQFMLKGGGLTALQNLLSKRLEQERLAIADKIAEKARELAPVKTGELRDSIHVDEEGNVVANAPHAVPVEMGTSRRAATPFLAPAAVSVMSDFEQAVAEAVQEVARGI